MKALLCAILCLFVCGQAAHAQQKTIQAVSYGIIADNSGSVRHQIDFIVDASKALADSAAPGDEIFLVRFTGQKNLVLVQELTGDKSAVANATDNLFIEAGDSAIIDAVYDSAKYLAKSIQASAVNRRYALILMTDGEDRKSLHKIDELTALLADKKIQVYSIGFVGSLKAEKGTKTYDKAVAFLSQLSSRTGGQAYFPKTSGDLNDAVKEIYESIHSLR